METFAYLETAIEHENPNQAQVRSLKELGLTVPNSAWLGVAALLLSTSMLVVQVPQAQAFPVTVVSSSGLNVRSGPGTGFAIIGGLGNGARVNVINSSGGWYQISGGGWIASNFTSTGGTGGGGTPVSGSVTTVAGVNIRSGPSTAFAIIGGLASGTTVRVVSLSNGFYQLSSGGWVSANYTTSPGSGGGGIPGTSARVATNGSDLLIRSSPSGGVIGSLRNGSTIRLSGRFSGGYAQLSSGGWVSTSWLIY